MAKPIKITKFLSKSQIKEAYRHRENVLKIRDHIIKPNIEEINHKLKQENDPLYLAYVVQYVLMRFP